MEEQQMETGKQTDPGLEENNALKELTGLMEQQGMGEHSQEYMELFRYTLAMQVQMGMVLNELKAVREQLSQLQDSQPKTVKEKLVEQAENLQEKGAALQGRLNRAKNSLLDTAAEAANAFMQKGKAAACKIIQKGLSIVRPMLAQCRNHMLDIMAGCVSAARQMDGIGTELQQIGNSVSNIGRLLAGKDTKELPSGKQGTGPARAAGKLFSSLAAALQKGINAAGKAVEKLDRLSGSMENIIKGAEKGGRESVTDKLSQMKEKASEQQKEAPGQEKETGKQKEKSIQKKEAGQQKEESGQEKEAGQQKEAPDQEKETGKQKEESGQKKETGKQKKEPVQKKETGQQKEASGQKKETGKQKKESVQEKVARQQKEASGQKKKKIKTQEACL